MWVLFTSLFNVYYDSKLLTDPERQIGVHSIITISQYNGGHNTFSFLSSAPTTFILLNRNKRWVSELNLYTTLGICFNNKY